MHLCLSSSWCTANLMMTRIKVRLKMSVKTEVMTMMMLLGVAAEARTETTAWERYCRRGDCFPEGERQSIDQAIEHTSATCSQVTEQSSKTQQQSCGGKFASKHRPGECLENPQTSLSLASFKSRLVLPLWFWITQVYLEKRPLNGCSIGRNILPYNFDTWELRAPPTHDAHTDTNPTQYWRHS